MWYQTINISELTLAACVFNLSDKFACRQDKPYFTEAANLKFTFFLNCDYVPAMGNETPVVICSISVLESLHEPHTQWSGPRICDNQIQATKHAEWALKLWWICASSAINSEGQLRVREKTICQHTDFYYL